MINRTKVTTRVCISFVLRCGYNVPAFHWDEQRCFLLCSELDTTFFHLYLPADANGDWRPARRADGCPHDETTEQLAELKRHFPTPRDAVSYIMDTFPIVRRKDESAHGHYRTKETILEIYDALQHSIATGQPYQTRLAPPRRRQLLLLFENENSIDFSEILYA